MFVAKIDEVIAVLEDAKEIAVRLDEGKQTSQAAIKSDVTSFRGIVYPMAKTLVGLFRGVLGRRDELLEGVAEVQKETAKEKLEAKIREMQDKLAEM